MTQDKPCRGMIGCHILENKSNASVNVLILKRRFLFLFQLVHTYLSYFQEYKVYAIKKGPGKHKEKLKINQNNKRHYWNLKHKDESIALNLQYTG